MKTTSMKNERRMAGWLVLWCMGLLAMAVSSCDSELDVQQQYPFTVETMPVPKQLANGETAEIRCEVKSEGDFDGTVYTIRYFQYDGTGSLKLEWRTGRYSNRMTAICWKIPNSGCIILPSVMKRRIWLWW